MACARARGLNHARAPRQLGRLHADALAAEPGLDGAAPRAAAAALSRHLAPAARDAGLLLMDLAPLLSRCARLPDYLTFLSSLSIYPSIALSGYLPT